MGNDASNAIGLATDTSFSGTAGLTGTQVLAGGVTSAATVNAELAAGLVAGNDAVANSSLATDGNIAFSRAMANNQNNTLDVSGASVTGVSTATEKADLAQLGAANTMDRILEGDSILSAFQGLLGTVSGRATIDSNIWTTDDIDASSVSASENIAQSNVIGNAGNNLLNLAAGTSVTGVSVLASEQNGRTGATITSVADLNFAFNQQDDANDDFTSSALNVDNNLGFSTAFGSDVANRLNATGTTVNGNDDALSAAGITAAGIVSGTSDNLVGTVQFRDASTVTSTADLNADLLSTADLGVGNQLDGSSVSLSGNTLGSTATSNRASNALVLNAATGLTSGGAIANQQSSASAVTSNALLNGSDGSAAFDDLNAFSIALRNNIGIARAAGNDATNVLNASAGTAITGIAGTGSATALAGALNASATFASASNQFKPSQFGYYPCPRWFERSVCRDCGPQQFVRRSVGQPSGGRCGVQPFGQQHDCLGPLAFDRREHGADHPSGGFRQRDLGSGLVPPRLCQRCAGLQLGWYERQRVQCICRRQLGCVASDPRLSQAIGRSALLGRSCRLWRVVVLSPTEPPDHPPHSYRSPKLHSKTDT
jgi:hypothetical protein